MFKFILPFTSVALTALWYPAMKPVFSEITPVQAATIEALACFICALLWLKVFQKRKIQFNQQIAVIGILNAIGSFLVYSSLYLLSPVASALLGRNYTIMCVILAFFFLKEKIKMNQLSLIILSIVGSILFVYRETIGDSELLGILFVIGYTIFFAIANILTKENLKNIDPITTLFYIKSISFITLFLFGLSTNGISFFQVSGTTFLYVSVISILSMFVGMLLFYKAIAALKFTYVNVIRGMNPLFVYVYSIPFFGIYLSKINMIGGILVLVSITLLSLIDIKESKSLEKTNERSQWQEGSHRIVKR